MKATQAVSTMMIWGVALGLGMTLGCGSSDKEAVASAKPLTEMQLQIEEAYIYGLPIIQNYQAMAVDALEPAGPDFKAPLNQLRKNVPVEDPEAEVGSKVWMDLRAEPMVLTVPDLEGERVYSVELKDLMTRRFGQIGTQALGNDEGNYLIAGPSWAGQAPKSIDKVFRADTDFAVALFRTRCPDPEDRDRVLAIQSLFKAQPLSSFIVMPAVEAAPELDFPPWSKFALGDDFIATLNFCLQFVHPDEAEKALWAKWAPIGVGPGLSFDFNALSPKQQKDIQLGVQSARARILQTVTSPAPDSE